MKMILDGLGITNFKGIKSFELDLGQTTTIAGENGTCKTTIADAFYWLFADKDSTGRSDFGVRPLDDDNKLIPGLTVSVEANIKIDGEKVNVKRENTEKLKRKVVTGYESSYWIDGVAMPQNKFKAKIKEWIDADTFKMLTNLNYINTLPWAERRALLAELPDEIGCPVGFEGFVTSLGKRTIAEQKKILSDEKTLHTKARDQINPRIDEIQRGLSEYAGTDKAKLEVSRQTCKDEIGTLNVSRETIMADEAKRQKRIDGLNTLKTQRTERAAALRSDGTGIKPLMDEKTAMAAAEGVENVKLQQAQNALNTATGELDGLKQQLKTTIENRETIKKQYNDVKSETDSTTCPTCEQPLPQDKIDELTATYKQRLNTIIKKGNKAQAIVEELNKAIGAKEAALAVFDNSKAEILANAKALEESNDIRRAEIDKLIDDNNALFDPEKDAQYMLIGKAIEKAEENIGESTLDRLINIESRKQQLLDQITKINATLAQADRAAKDKERIAELQKEESDLSQKIADIEKQLAEIADYEVAESELITEKVNGMFELVNWKLFDTYLGSDGIKKCCEATLNGVPYSDMSGGQKMAVGIDIINTISKHNNVTVPLFVDNAESLTIDCNPTCQTIKLFAVKGQKTLKIT